MKKIFVLAMVSVFSVSSFALCPHSQARLNDSTSVSYNKSGGIGGTGSPASKITTNAERSTDKRKQ